MVKIYRNVAVNKGSFNKGKFRKNKIIPIDKATYILDQVIFSFLTPFVPKQLNANSTKAKILVYKLCENKPAVRSKLPKILLIISSVQPRSKKKP
ncbi:hypothetical protein AC804_07145 [Chryseobacterium sp. Hurlbut01]|nr:hypothetical protein AC804_07145 [Chryseobacterium sp. Hurlbut01]